MNSKRTTLYGVALALGVATQAHAQNEGEKPPEKPLAAPTNAFEIVVGTGYTQGFGNLQSGVDLQSVATAGISADVGLGYRISPHWSVSAVGQYQEFDAAGNGYSARGLTGGLPAAAFHSMPYNRIDPWVQLGTGYRLLWLNHPDQTPGMMTHGFELAKLTVGMDVRVSPGVAVAPLIGADLTLPLWESTGNAPSQEIADPRVSAYVFAGLQARFDVGQFVGGTQAAPPVSETQTTQAPLAPRQAGEPRALGVR